MADSPAIHYDILINPPKKVPITSEEFDRLSYYGLASLFCNYRLVIDKAENCYQVYMQSFWYQIRGDYRLEGLKCRSYPSAEMFRLDVPFDHPLTKTIEKNFGQFIMDKV